MIGSTRRTRRLADGDDTAAIRLPTTVPGVVRRRHPPRFQANDISSSTGSSADGIMSGAK